MTPSELQSLASACYGARWQSALSRDMGIALRTVSRWARDGIAKPATAEGVRRFLEERRIARIAAPPSDTTADQDRDDACYAALQPGVRALIAAAEEIGWHPAEALTSALAIVVDEIEARAGRAAAQEIVDQQAAVLKNTNRVTRVCA